MDGTPHIETEVKVRTATPDDLDALMALATMAHDENGFVKANPRKLLNDMWPAVHQDKGIVGIIGEPNAQIEAAVLLRIGTIWYSDEPMIEERGVFVHPSYRQAKGGRLARLVEFSRQVADELGFPLTMGVLSNHRTSAKIKTYTRIMGEPAGAYWLYGAHTGMTNDGVK